jgi:hypothetical protein
MNNKNKKNTIYSKLKQKVNELKNNLFWIFIICWTLLLVKSNVLCTLFRNYSITPNKIQKMTKKNLL